jgi:hypothetical protein
MKLTPTTWFALAALGAPLAAPARAQAVAPARAEAVGAADWAAALLESPHFFADDRDERAAELLALIERAPDHPLVELGLRVLRDFSADKQRAFVERCLALDPGRMTPAARAEFEALRVVRAAERASLGSAPPADLARDRLRPSLVIGPLPDVYDRAARLALLEAPNFAGDRPGYPGKRERWTPCVQPKLELFVDPDELVDEEYGWGAVAFGFRAAQGGPAWIELDVGGDVGPNWATTRSWRDGGALSEIDDPSLDLRINDAPSVHLDLLSRERVKKLRYPTVLRTGGNQVLVALNLGARLRIAVRVLDANGAPYPGLEGEAAAPQLGASVAAEPPQTPVMDALAWLEAQGDTSPRGLALHGAAHLWLGETVRGSQLLAQAVAADATQLGARTWLAEFFNSECYAPQSWARGRARGMFESLAVENPTNLRAVSVLADTWSDEDREEEALELLSATSSAAPSSPHEPLQRWHVLSRLELEVPAERALLEASARSPESPRAALALAQHWASNGQPSRAAAERDRALAAAGGSPGQLGAAAGAHASLGEVDEALRLRRLAAEIGGDDERDELADYLQSLERYAEAEELVAALAKAHPESAYYRRKLADLARLGGDSAAEASQLEAALALAPSDDSLRKRLRAHGKADAAEEFFAKWSIDSARELEGFDATRWNDHVVRAIDAAAVYVFEDGAWEQVSHSRSVARDLEGCEALGKQSEHEEMLRIATLKAADGVEYEPVLVDGEYVMPALEPGDTVELVWKYTGGPDREGRLVLPQWSFASVDEPFFLSRYVVSLPKGLGLEMVLRNFEGKHEEIEDGERVVHVFELRDVARVIPEPLAPPPLWYLPWVQFGTQRSKESMAEQARVELAASLRVTPQIVEAAERAAAEAAGQEQKARALHALVVSALDKRSSGLASATGALLQREGNPAILYSALLSAVGIEHELVWSRGVDPRADQEPNPAFLDLGRWIGRMLVVVRPDDGPEAWCNLGVKTMPYGTQLLDSPRAEGLSVLTGRFIECPDSPLPELTGESTQMTLALAPDRSARVSIDFTPTGNFGHLWKEGLREAPKAQLKQVAARIASQIVRGFELEDHQWPGLESEEELHIRAEGVHKRYLDKDKDELTCRSPFPPLQMGGLARGEGERKQPFFFPQALVRSWKVRFELDPALKLVQGVEDVELECLGARFHQTLRADGDNAFVVERSLLAPPLHLTPEQFPQFVAFCKRLDELDRAKMRFATVE